MRIFRKCFYCSQYSLEPVDSAQEILKEHFKNAMSTGETSIPDINWQKNYNDWIMECLTQKCSFCTHPLSAKYSVEDALKYAYKIYDEFYEFMNGVNLPKEIVIEFVDGGLYFEGMYEYDEVLKKFVVKIHISQIIYFNQFKSRLFHEFCHLMDDYDPLTGKKKVRKSGAALSKFYTEIHAKYIELMSLLGFKNVNEIRTVRLESKLPYDGKYITLKEYLEKVVEGLGKRVTKCCNMENAFENNDDIIEVTRIISYYRGIIIFCKNYLNEESFHLIPNGNYLEDILKEKFPDDADDFSELLSILDNHLANVLNDIDGSLVDEIMTKIISLILVNTPKLKKEKEMFKTQLQHSKYMYKNWNTFKGVF